jgi:hypothetical protein
VTPEETAGPYYFDPGLLRRDIREGKPGVPLDLELTVVDEACKPHSGVLVDLWHCDKDGCYSGYDQPACDAAGQAFLRGTQITDARGIVRFTTIYPGWYPGRATHIHFKVRTETTTYKTSQFAFPEWANAAVCASPLYARRGANPTSNQEDGLFHEEDRLYLTAGVAGDPGKGFVGTFTAGLEESAAAAPEVESRPRLALAGAPAPFRNRTTLHASLPVAGFAELTIYDAPGRRVRTLASGWRRAGTFDSVWDGRDQEGRRTPAGVYLGSLRHWGQHAFARLVRVR